MKTVKTLIAFVVGLGFGILIMQARYDHLWKKYEFLGAEYAVYKVTHE